MVGRKYATTFYLLLLKLACTFRSLEVYNALPTTWGMTPQFFSTASLFCSFVLLFFSQRRTIILDLDFDFECVLILQQLLYFTLEPRHPLFQKDALSRKVLHSFIII